LHVEEEVPSDDCYENDDTISTTSHHSDSILPAASTQNLVEFHVDKQDSNENDDIISTARSETPCSLSFPHKDEALSDDSNDSYDSYDSYDNSETNNHSNDDSDNDAIMSLKEKCFEQPCRSTSASQPVFSNTWMTNIDEDNKDNESYSEDSFNIDDNDDAESIVDASCAKGTDQRKQRRHNFPYTVARKIDIVKIAKRENNIRQTALHFGVDPK
jgi:hypothetical protein